jgi:Fe-S oxidoreductase
MINQKLVDNIRSYGTFKDSGGKRRQTLEKIGFRIGEDAEYVIKTGCFAPEGMPHVLSAFKTLLDRFEVNYTLLEKEYCCGWMPLGQPAVMAKNEEDIATSKELSKEFILQNFRQAESLGAKSIVLFCSACEPSYSNLQDETSLEVISYTELLDRHFPGGKLDLGIDYYAGCYRFRRRITDKPLDIEPAVRVLNRIEGLRVNHLDNDLCCYIPPHIDQLTQKIRNNTIVTICTGCYYNLAGKLSEKGNTQVKMLPEILVL